MAPKSLLSRGLFTLSALFQVVGTLTADWSASHIYNAAWPPHAKFHTGQTISMAIVLAALGLYFAFRPKHDAKQHGSSSLRQYHDDIWTAMMILDVYWVTQALAFLYPGTYWCDEGFCFDAPFPPQWGVEVIGISLNALAFGFESWALATEEKSGKKSI